MENDQVNKLCKIRDIYRLIYQFEFEFQKKYNLCLNEGMLLCTLKEKEHTSTELAELLGLRNSNTSKVIRAVESKKLIERKIGTVDKRIMSFKLTQLGIDTLNQIKCQDMEVPGMLKELIK